MRKALISPNEKIYSIEGTFIGNRIAEVSDIPFEVAEPLFWMDCEDDVVANEYYYDENEKIIKKKFIPEENLPEEV